MRVDALFIAMNRFTVKLSCEDAFVTMWKSRDSYLEEVPGFISFHLLRGPASEDAVIYATHTMWASEEDFRNWVKSDEFRKAHQGMTPQPELFAAPSKLELFDSVL